MLQKDIKKVFQTIKQSNYNFRIKMERREFIKHGSMAAAAFTILPMDSLFAANKDKVRLGYIGVGERGMNHISEGTLRDDVEIVAICDIQERSLKICREFIAKQGRPAATEYTGG